MPYVVISKIKSIPSLDESFITFRILFDSTTIHLSPMRVGQF